MKAPRFTVEFPLADGKRLRNRSDGEVTIAMPLTYDADGLTTTHNADFLKSPLFANAYAKGLDTGHRLGDSDALHIEWRIYLCCWAAAQACRLPGDFVECGVSTGITARAIAEYVGFAALQKSFYLFDTFEGIPEEQIQSGEEALAKSKNERHYFDCFELVQNTFSNFPNIHPIKGIVPGSLKDASIDQVAYLHIDMNIAAPEVAAIEYFWPKMAVGGLVIFDDYGGLAHGLQKQSLDEWAVRNGQQILTLPTGQGLLLKPPGL